MNKVEFGALSPILCNFKWEPQFKRQAHGHHGHDQGHGQGHGQGQGQGQGQGEPTPDHGSTSRSGRSHNGGGKRVKLSADALDAEHAFSSVVVAADVTFRSGITIYLDTNVTLMGLKVKVSVFVTLFPTFRG